MRYQFIFGLLAIVLLANASYAQIKTCKELKSKWEGSHTQNNKIADASMTYHYTSDISLTTKFVLANEDGSEQLLNLNGYCELNGGPTLKLSGTRVSAIGSLIGTHRPAKMVFTVTPKGEKPYTITVKETS